MARVVMFVSNDVRFDSRVRREATSLTADGHQVTLMTLAPRASAPRDLPDHDGSFSVVRVRARRPWIGGRRRWEDLRDRPWRLLRREAGRAWRGDRGRPGSADRIRAVGIAAGLAPWSVVRAIRGIIPVAGRSVGVGGASGIRWLVEWHDRVAGWADVAGRAAPAADVYHGHDLDGVRAALTAVRCHGGGRVVYDCHDLMLVGGTSLARPRWARWLMGRVERRWIRGADATVTVAAPMAEALERLGARSPLVLRNCASLWIPDDDAESPLRAAIGVGPEVPIVIYHGGFYPYRGLETIVACADRPELRECVFVFLGYGGLEPMLREAAAHNPAIHVLPAVTPAELPSWLAGADVGVGVYAWTPNYAVTIPNKLFECLMAGLPMVVSDFDPWRQLVMEDPSGPFGLAVAPDDLDAVTAAIVALLTRSRTQPAERQRLRRAAVERLNWETEVEGFLRLYRSLSGSVAGPPS